MSIKVEGIGDIKKILSQIAPNHGRNLMRATVHGVASEINKRAKSLVPKKTRNLQKSLKAKREKSHPDAPVSSVIAESGKDKKNDGFYWRFVEKGTKNMKGKKFLEPARDSVIANLDSIITAQFTKKLEAKIKKEMKKR